MKHLNKASLFILLILISCKNGQDNNDNNSVDQNASAINADTEVNTEKQDPIFTPSKSPYPLSSAVQVGDILYLSGVIADAGDGTGVIPGGITAETHHIFERMQATLSQHGLGLDDVFKCTVMLADMSEWKKFNEVYAGYFKAGRYPTRSAMGVNALALGARVELECWACKPKRK